MRAKRTNPSSFLRSISLRRLFAGAAFAALAAAAGLTIHPTSASAEAVLSMHIEEQTSWVQNFNPFDLGGRRKSTMDFIYEPLVIFNDYDGGKPIWRLATAYKFSDDLKSITYTLRDGVKWSDGVPVTAADILLSWVSTSGLYNTAEITDKAYTEDGQLLPFKGAAFDASSPGSELITKFPVISDKIGRASCRERV